MLTNWANKIDEIKDAYLGEFLPIDLESLNWKPDARSWSIAQCIDHVIATNAQIEIVRRIAEFLNFWGFRKNPERWFYLKGKNLFKLEINTNHT